MHSFGFGEAREADPKELSALRKLGETVKPHVMHDSYK